MPDSNGKTAPRKSAIAEKQKLQPPKKQKGFPLSRMRPVNGKRRSAAKHIYLRRVGKTDPQFRS